MQVSLADTIRGCISVAVLAANSVVSCALLYLAAALKLAIPNERWRAFCRKVLNGIAQCWVGCNNFGLLCTKNLHWDVQGLESLTPKNWYLVLANHQSWVDIVILQKIFHGKIPMLKFFLKKELIWVPLLGAAWWVLEFPFMVRGSAAFKDLDTTRKACEKFRLLPVSIMNFVEGTRFSQKKRVEQQSPYQHLLKPRAGGIALVLSTMGDQLSAILDVTIAYPQGTLGVWKFLCAKSMDIKVRIKTIPITEELLGDHFGDRTFRREFNDWLNRLWEEKDQLLATLLPAVSQHPTATGDR
jgi:1-acyl-sn-glycerol-3-phosphate acyltransferase